MMTRVDERSPETSMTEIVDGPCAAGWPDGSMAIHVSGSASATAGTRARLIEPPLGKHPVGTRTPGRCQGAREEGGGGLFRSAAERPAWVCHTREYHGRKRQGMSREADTAPITLEFCAHMYIH